MPILGNFSKEFLCRRHSQGMSESGVIGQGETRIWKLRLITVFDLPLLRSSLAVDTALGRRPITLRSHEDRHCRAASAVDVSTAYFEFSSSHQ